MCEEKFFHGNLGAFQKREQEAITPIEKNSTERSRREGKDFAYGVPLDSLASNITNHNQNYSEGCSFMVMDRRPVVVKVDVAGGLEILRQRDVFYVAMELSWQRLWSCNSRDR